MSNSKSISKYFKEGDLITNLENLAASQGYVSAKKLHSQNNIINDDDEDHHEEEEDDKKKEKENISDFLSNGNYYVPSYLTFLNDDKNGDENGHDDDKNENITITITPVEKCNPIDDELYNKLVESAELQGTSNNKKSSKNSKNKKTKKVLNKNKKSKVGGGGGKKTKRKN
jgi:hypothetical protein